MYNLAICIPTYKRLILLKSLISSILNCNIDKSLIKCVDIIIVDNDIDMSAELIKNELGGSLNGIYKLYYYNFPIKGLSNVRNELIRKSMLQNPDFLLFIDDDEYVTVDWLNELVKVITRNDGDMAIGPVLSVFSTKISRYLSYWFRRPEYSDNSQLKYIRTGNLIINAKSILKFGVWFDDRFNKTGSEDTYFGIQMVKKGATVFYAANAVAYEIIPFNRANLRWLMGRRYRAASTVVYIRKLEKDYKGILKKTIGSMYYIISGFISLIIITLPIEKKYWGILRLSEGIGGIAGLLNLKYNEYQ